MVIINNILNNRKKIIEGGNIMSYIVKSSLGIEPTILPWNEVEKEKLIDVINHVFK